MLKFKRTICWLLLLVTVVSLLPRETLAFSVTSPSMSVTDTKYFTALPGVYEMGDGYAVIWATSFSGTGYIQYTYNGVRYTVYDQKNNIVRTNDNVHVVKVPHEHLLGNSYTVYSTEVTSHQYAITNYGTTISAGPIYLKAYDGGVNDFDVLVLTDTHKKLDWSKTVASRFGDDPDLVVFSGDIVDSIETKSDICLMFNIMGSVTGGRYPIVYCRGNHETRGISSTALLDYFPTETGEFYFDFRYGPLWGVVMDTGEDKDDTHEYYGNLANYKEYNQKQEAWLRSLRMDTTATYRFGIYHIPRIHDLNNGLDFTDSVGHLGLQFAVSGHFHTAEVYDKVLNNAQRIRHDSFVCGGYAKDAATLVTLDKTTQKAYVTVRSQTGSIVDGFDHYGISFSNYVGAVPEPLEVPTSGTNAVFAPTAASQGTVSISVAPTVFETGGDWYNVVWKTATTNSSAKGRTGYVEYEYNGQTYQLYDEAGGYRRSGRSIHSVKVPKEHLNNNKYRVGSFLVHYAYTNPTAQTGRYYTTGDYVESGEYVFENRAGDQAVNIVACPDIKLAGSDATRITAVQKVVEGLGTSPTLVLVNGDAVSISLDTTSDMTALFKATSIVSGGIHPVVFSRGNSECRGYSATDLIEYIPTATGEFYYSFRVGDYTFVNLDTAEDDPDDQMIEWQGSTVKKYGGRVSFDRLRAEQLQWINSLPAGKLVAVSHIPFGTVKNRFGIDFETALKTKGAVLCIAGHDTDYSVKETVDANNVYTIVPGGFNNSTSHNTSTSILLSENYAYLNTCKYLNGTTTYPDTKTVDLSNGTEVSYAAVQPPVVNGVYQLSLPGHVQWISENCTSVSSFAGSSFVMTGDIDMMLVPFTPIGGNDTLSADSNTTSRSFAGTFDGNGYRIKNVNIVTEHNNAGFFGSVRGATVKRLTLSSGMVDGGWYLGGLAGYAYGTTFEDCYSHLTVYSAGGSKVAGLVGFLSHGSVVNRCANYGNVSAHHSGGSAGGIAGQIYSATKNQILNSYNRGSIAAHGTSGIAGGIFGYAGNVGTVITNCYNAAAVTSPGSQGAIIGSYSKSGNLTVSNSYFADGFNGAAYGTKTTNSWSSAEGSGTITVLQQPEMKSQATAQRLNAEYFTCKASVNDGYPVHINALHAPGTTGHTYQAVVTEPTCTQVGCTTYTCACGDSYTEEIPATGHSYDHYVCTGCADVLDITIYFDTAVKGWESVNAHVWNADGPLAQWPGTPMTHMSGTVYSLRIPGNMTSVVFNDGTWQTGDLVIPGDGYAHDGYHWTPWGDAFGTAFHITGSGDALGNWDPAYAGGLMTNLGGGMFAAVFAGLPAGTYEYKVTGGTWEPSWGYGGGNFTFTLKAPSNVTVKFDVNTCSSTVEVACLHSYSVAVKAPTCTEGGYTTYTCPCGHSYIGDETSAPGHRYETVTVDPTCTTDGSITRTCSRCGEVNVEILTAPGHNYVNYVCTGCGDVKYITVYFDTSVKGWKTVTASMKTEDGWVSCDVNPLGGTLYAIRLPGSITAVRFSNDLYETEELAVAGDGWACDGYRWVPFGEAFNTVFYVTGSSDLLGNWDPAFANGLMSNHGDGVFTVSFANVPVGTYEYRITNGTQETFWGDFAFTINAPSNVTVKFDVNTNRSSVDVGCLHSYEGVVTSPTCTQGGYTTYSCVCGDSYIADQVAAYGHSYTETVTDATCDMDGIRVYTCTRCADSYSETIPAFGHSHEAQVTAPSCTEAGYTTYTCSVCADSYVSDMVEAAGHQYEDHVCTVCGDVRNITVYFDTAVKGWESVNAHVWNAEGPLTQWPGLPMTHEQGSVYSIQIPGNMTSVVFNNGTWQTGDLVIPADGSACDGYQWVVYGEAFGTVFHVTGSGDILGDWDPAYAGGLMTNLGGGCFGVTFSDVPAGDYEYKVTSGTWEPSWGDGAGNLSFSTCAPSHVTVRFDVNACTAAAEVECLHDYRTVITEATCTQDGYTTYTCPCGDSYVAEVIASPGHRYEPVVSEPTCTEDGFTLHTCSVCGDSYTDSVVPAAGHSYVSTVTPPTCTQDGFTTHICSRCGSTFTDSIVNTTGHSFADGFCRVCGEKDPDYVESVTQPAITLKYPTLVFEDVIMMNVYFDASDLQDVTEMGLITYKDNVPQWNVDNAEAMIPGYAWSEKDQLYYATTEGIPAKNLGDDIYFAVYAKLIDGSYYYSRLVSYSPEDYAYTQLSQGGPEIKPLVVAMLNYGAAAQCFFNYNTDKLVNRNLTDEQKAMVEDYRADMMAAVPGVTGDKEGTFANTGGYVRRYPSISFEGAFAINYYYIPSAMPLGDVTMYYWNQSAFSDADVLTADNATAIIKMSGEGTGTYHAAVEGIAAKDLDQGVYVSFVYTDGVNEYASGVLAYSVGTYCSLAASENTELTPLAQATAVYGYYAKQTFKG